MICLRTGGTVSSRSPWKGEHHIIRPIMKDPVFLVQKSAPAMEADLRDLLRLRRQVPCAAIVLEDRGLTEESRELAEYFCQRYDGVVLEVHSGTSER